VSLATSIGRSQRAELLKVVGAPEQVAEIQLTARVQDRIGSVIGGHELKQLPSFRRELRERDRGALTGSGSALAGWSPVPPPLRPGGPALPEARQP
jgi:regulator of protease activity HflC (stomatin/prohibitin superfamily)